MNFLLRLVQTYQLAGRLRAARSQIPWITVSILTFCLISLGLESLSAYLAYDRSALQAGELWRIFTAHTVHYNAKQFVWDGLMFGVFGCWLERTGRRGYAALLVFASILVYAAIYFFDETVGTYRGLSGLDTAFFTIWAGYMLERGIHHRSTSGIVIGVLALAGSAGKIGYEAFTGTSLFSSGESGYVVLHGAHLAGVVAGGLFFLWRLVDRGGSPPEPSAPPLEEAVTATTGHANLDQVIAATPVNPMTAPEEIP